MRICDSSYNKLSLGWCVITDGWAMADSESSENDYHRLAFQTDVSHFLVKVASKYGKNIQLLECLTLT